MLPISASSSRTRLQKATKEKKEKKEKKVPTIQIIEEPIENENLEQEKLELQEIPIVDENINDLSNLDEIPLEQSQVIESGSLSDIPSKIEQDLGDEKKPILQEIKPKPFRGTIISNKSEFRPPVTQSKDLISDAFTALKKSVLEVEIKKPKPSLSPLPQKTLETDAAIIKQKY